MDSVNKTLYIPLYGKAQVSRKGLFLHDPKAEEIWAAEGFPLKGKSRSKWLAYYMGMRSAVFDHWLEEMLAQKPEAVVIHPGCGMDSRVLRVGTRETLWFDVDFPEVIAERRRYFTETGSYHMIGSDIRQTQWLSQIPEGRPAVIVLEGVSMYLSPEELKELLRRWKARFPELYLLMDSYTVFAARASRYRNPINDVGVTTVYGLDDPVLLAEGPGLSFIKEHDMTPEELISQLKGWERAVFRKVFGGSLARKLYRLYEYR